MLYIDCWYNLSRTSSEHAHEWPHVAYIVCATGFCCAGEQHPLVEVAQSPNIFTMSSVVVVIAEEKGLLCGG